MQISGNTILITGGTSGIGRALAEAFHARGNRVIVTGRRRALLDEVAAANSGMRAFVVDMDNPEELRSFARQIISEFPQLNALIHNAGIMRPEKLQEGQTADAEAIISTNLLGPIRLTAALLPTLLQQPKAAILTVSSGLAFVPLTMTPTYCATKAAIHSYTQSLRYQLRDTAVQVLEIIPPYVQTELTGPQQAQDERAMPLKDFIEETMSILERSPDEVEVCVERVKVLRNAECSGRYGDVFGMLNAH